MTRTSLAIIALLSTTPALAQTQWPYGGPPMWDRDYANPEYHRERRLPERSYDPYDRGTERGYPQPQPMGRDEYERRAFCAMHPRECQ